MCGIYKHDILFSGNRVLQDQYLHGSGACSPEKIFKNGTIWCASESILLKFCQK